MVQRLRELRLEELSVPQLCAAVTQILLAKAFSRRSRNLPVQSWALIQTTARTWRSVPRLQLAQKRFGQLVRNGVSQNGHSTDCTPSNSTQSGCTSISEMFQHLDQQTSQIVASFIALLLHGAIIQPLRVDHQHFQPTRATTSRRISRLTRQATVRSGLPRTSGTRSWGSPPLGRTTSNQLEFLSAFNVTSVMAPLHRRPSSTPTVATVP